MNTKMFARALLVAGLVFAAPVMTSAAFAADTQPTPYKTTKAKASTPVNKKATGAKKTTKTSQTAQKKHVAKKSTSTKATSAKAKSGVKKSSTATTN